MHAVLARFGAWRPHHLASSCKIVQNVAKTYRKMESIEKAEIFVKKWAKTSSETGILKTRPPGQLIGEISSGEGRA